jgi:hypothetical protein
MRPKCVVLAGSGRRKSNFRRLNQIDNFADNSLVDASGLHPSSLTHSAPMLPGMQLARNRASG